MEVQKYYECTVHPFLWKKGSILACCYNTPWELHDESILFINEKGQNKYEPAHNDDRLNVHNAHFIAMWCAIVDCQSIVSHHAVLKYIANYASKKQKWPRSYHDMLTIISNASSFKDLVLCAYKRFL